LPRRERIFWLFVGAVLVVGFIALIPAHGEICKEAEKAQQESCTAYSLVPFLAVKVGKILDALGVAITAIATIFIVWFTLSLRQSTDKLWDAGERQLALLAETSAAQSRDMQASLKVATDSAIAANRSAKVAEEALVTNDRAWISIKAEVIGPLVFEKDRVHIGIGFDMINVGNSPATHVEILAELCPDIVSAGESGVKAAGISSLSLFSFGVVLFPGDVERRDWLEMEMPLASFEGNIAGTQARAKERGEDEREVSTARPGVMVRAAYKLAGSTRPRHTVILYEVRRKPSDASLGWDGSEGKTDLVYLNLVQTFMSGQVT
jgi:hypothetical protein